LRNVQ